MKSLEVKALEESNKYKQSSHAVFTPNPLRAVLVGDTGTGKTSAAAIMFEALMPLCSRFHLIAPTIHTDGSFDKFRNLIDAGLKREGVLASDPGENPYHDSMDALKDVIAQATRRTKAHKAAGEKYCPQTILYIDDAVSFFVTPPPSTTWSPRAGTSE